MTFFLNRQISLKTHNKDRLYKCVSYIVFKVISDAFFLNRQISLKTHDIDRLYKCVSNIVFKVISDDILF